MFLLASFSRLGSPITNLEDLTPNASALLPAPLVRTGWARIIREIFGREKCKLVACCTAFRLEKWRVGQDLLLWVIQRGTQTLHIRRGKTPGVFISKIGGDDFWTPDAPITPPAFGDPALSTVPQYWGGLKHKKLGGEAGV